MTTLPNTAATIRITRHPLRVLESFIARMRRSREVHGECGGFLETQILGDTAAAIRLDMQAAAAESSQLVTQEAAVENTLREITSPSSEAGQAITPAEQRRLDLELSALRTTATTHAANLKELSS